jgi:hypothetical protein
LVFAARFGFYLALRWHLRLRLRASSVAVWCAGLFAGIRDLLTWFTRRRLVFWPLRWHPRVAFVLQASPLCGAAPTFLCRRKEK